MFFKKKAQCQGLEQAFPDELTMSCKMLVSKDRTWPLPRHFLFKISNCKYV